MAFGAGIVGLALLTLWVYCVFDVIRTDEPSVRNLPKLVWLLVVVFLPTVGSLAWLALGRPSRAPYGGGDTPRRQPRSSPSPRSSRARAGGRQPRGPDDSPEFLTELERRARELKRRRGDNP